MIDSSPVTAVSTRAPGTSYWREAASDGVIDRQSSQYGKPSDQCTNYTMTFRGSTILKEFQFFRGILRFTVSVNTGHFRDAI